MKKEIGDEQGKILAMKLFSNDTDILSHMNGNERRRQKMEVLLKKVSCQQKKYIFPIQYSGGPLFTSTTLVQY